MAYEITAEQYRSEWTNAFQRGDTYLKDAVTKELVTEGHSAAVFAIGGVSSGMTSRGSNGLIPSRNTTDTQVTLTLKERHSKARQTGFNVFTAHGAGLRQKMQFDSNADAAREIDDEIILGLSEAVNLWNPNPGTAAAGDATDLTYGAVTDIISTLWEANAGDEVCCVWTAKSWAKIVAFNEFKSFDYVDAKPLMGDQRRPVYWNNAMHIMHTGLPERGTATAKNFAFAKMAMGHAIATDEIKVASGYNEEDDYSFDRATIYHRSAVLQQAGLISITTDDTQRIA